MILLSISLILFKSADVASHSPDKNIFFEESFNSNLCFLDPSIAIEGSTKHKLGLKESSRNMFLSGEWDATSTLLSNIKLIESKLDHLPYINLNK